MHSNFIFFSYRIPQTKVILTNYHSLIIRSSFDADSYSLAMLSIQQQTMSSLATWIEMVVLKSSMQGNIYDDTDLEFVPDLTPCQYKMPVELSGILENIEKVAEIFSKLDKNESPYAKPISHLHTTALTEVVNRISSHPLPYPRFFYQSLQQTKIKLQVNPQPKTSGEPVAVNTSQFMAVKVEGVIQRSRSIEEKSMSRQVEKIVVKLTTSLNKSVDKPNVIKSDGQLINMEQEAEPHNDFFVSQFLVPFPNPGQYTVNIETMFKDGQGRSWFTGSSSSITVKSFEDRNSISRSVRS